MTACGRIARSAGAFLYYVSLTGVTGAATDLARASLRAAEVRQKTGLPVALGFGVKTPDDARTVARHVDGVIVGAAVCRAIEEAKSPAQAVAAVRELIGSLRDVCVKG